MIGILAQRGKFVKSRLGSVLFPLCAWFLFEKGRRICLSVQIRGLFSFFRAAAPKNRGSGAIRADADDDQVIPVVSVRSCRGFFRVSCPFTAFSFRGVRLLDQTCSASPGGARGRLGGFLLFLDMHTRKEKRAADQAALFLFSFLSVPLQRATIQRAADGLLVLPGMSGRFASMGGRLLDQARSVDPVGERDRLGSFICFLA